MRERGDSFFFFFQEFGLGFLGWKVRKKAGEGEGW